MSGGWDVVELYESGRWAFTLNLIDHLPRTSAFAEALAEDDELADGAEESPAGRRVIPVTEFSPEVEALAVVADRLADVANCIIGSVGGKPTRVAPYPRPVTAFDRARARRRREAAVELERKLFPNLHQ